MPEAGATPGFSPRRLAVRARPSPGVIAVVACLALGAVSVLTLPSLPSYDPFSWVVWGHELAHQLIAPHEPFVLNGGPSWKPLPVAFTTIFGFFGAAPTLWVAFVRAAGLLGLFLAYRLAARLGGSSRWSAAGPIAGVLAALAVLLTTQWAHYMFRATSEPLVVTFTLWAIERHLAGRRLEAFLAGVALTLMRPEAALFVAVYALWCLFTMPGARSRLTLVAGILLIPAAWVLPPWLASGQALMASNHARDYHGNHGTNLFLQVVGRAGQLTAWPVIIAALAVTLLAIHRRDRVTMTLAAMSLAYVAVVAAMTLDHYPGLGRFMLPAAAVVCVLAGAGVVRLATFAGGDWASLSVATALVAVAVPFFGETGSAAIAQNGSSLQAVRTYDQMVGATRRAGASEDVFPCQRSRAAINHSVQPSLAWALGVPLTQVLGVTRTDRSLHRPALAFFAPGSQITGGAPRTFVDGLRGRVVGRSGIWKVIRVIRGRNASANACVGT